MEQEREAQFMPVENLEAASQRIHSAAQQGEIEDLRQRIISGELVVESPSAP